MGLVDFIIPARRGLLWSQIDEGNVEAEFRAVKASSVTRQCTIKAMRRTNSETDHGGRVLFDDFIVWALQRHLTLDDLNLKGSELGLRQVMEDALTNR